ncbi:MAG: DUF3343 domain-containing protein [candidate division Zixibacteria bacterium]|nr:DUF3343 domain-containing protein [candidate division Zixibacteria bacterium]
MSGHGVVLFHTTSAAMRAEKVAKKAGLDVKLIPTPRQLSSDCGIALRFNREEGDDVRNVLDEARVEYDGLRKI